MREGERERERESREGFSLRLSPTQTHTMLNAVLTNNFTICQEKKDDRAFLFFFFNYINSFCEARLLYSRFSYNIL